LRPLLPFSEIVAQAKKQKLFSQACFCPTKILLKKVKSSTLIQSTLPFALLDYYLGAGKLALLQKN